MEYRGLQLDPFQEQAIRHIEDGRSVLVAAPTGTGKTLIADYLIDHVLSENGKIIYTAPIKALSNQKYREYVAQFGREQVGLITGDIVINRDAPVRIMTTEILRNILLQSGQVESYLRSDEVASYADTLTAGMAALDDLEDLRAVIVDEIHFVDDEDRGTVWEELLIYLPTEIRILGLSATLSNLEEFAAWLSHIREQDVKVVREEQRAVPLEVQIASKETGIVSPEAYRKKYIRWTKEQKEQRREERKDRRRGRGRGRGDRRDRRESSVAKTRHLDVMEMLPSDYFPALYFIYSRKLTEQLAVQLSKSNLGRKLARRADTRAIDEVLERFDADFPGVMSRSLRINLRRGIAYHHAGMHVGLKALVEELYERKLIQVLYATSTFALGINMPARTVVFDSLTKFNGVEIVPLTVREFMQMAGRAGRRGIDVVGDAIIRLDYPDYPEVQQALREVLRGHSEPVSSSFNLSFNSVVNLLDRYTEDQIRTILERSFRAFQLRKEAEQLQRQLELTEERAPDDARTHRRKLAMMNRRLTEAQRPLLWEQFQRKIAFLRTYGYLGRGNELNSSARILQKIQFEEIFVTELVLDGVFEDLNLEEIFGVMCGLVQTLPRTAKVNAPGDDKWWEIFERVGAVYESDVVYNAQFQVGQESVFTPPLMPLGEMWALGAPLSDILAQIHNPTDLSGDIVGAFRRAKDLVSQLRKIYADDAERRKELTELIRSVSRDEVQVID